MEANDDGLQAYSELLAQKNAILPFGAKRSLEDLQNQLKAIIDLFAEKISLRDLTVKMIIRL